MISESRQKRGIRSGGVKRMRRKKDVSKVWMAKYLLREAFFVISDKIAITQRGKLCFLDL